MKGSARRLAVGVRKARAGTGPRAAGSAISSSTDSAGIPAVGGRRDPIGNAEGKPVRVEEIGVGARVARPQRLGEKVLCKVLQTP